MHVLAAYRPFLDPLPADAYWLWFALPLIVLVCVVYKAIRLDDLRELPRETRLLVFQIVAFIGLLAAAVWLLTGLV